MTAAGAVPLAELVGDAFSNLYALRQRSALALLGIVIGTASVVAMLTVGHMAEQEALRLFSRMGLNTLVVLASASSPDLPTMDVAAVEGLPERLREIELAAPLITGHLVVDVAGAPQELAVAASSPGLQDLAGLQIRSGRFIAAIDDQNLVAVLGAEAAAKLGKPGMPAAIGRSVGIGRYFYTVVGVLDETPAAAFTPVDLNNAVIIPLAASRRALGPVTPNAAMVRVRGGADIVAASASLKAELERSNPAVQIQIQSPRQLIETARKQKAVHTRLLAAIGGISLLVGGIGVMNVMLMGVMERRREIGLRAALGAGPRDVQLMFLVEAATLALVGGIVGALSGVAAAYVVAASSGWVFSVPLYALPLGSGMATIVGLVFGIYPAVKASHLDPIEALRAE